MAPGLGDHLGSWVQSGTRLRVLPAYPRAGSGPWGCTATRACQRSSFWQQTQTKRGAEQGQSDILQCFWAQVLGLTGLESRVAPKRLHWANPKPCNKPDPMPHPGAQTSILVPFSWSSLSPWSMPSPNPHPIGTFILSKVLGEGECYHPTASSRTLRD